MSRHPYSHDRDTHNQRAAREVVPLLMDRFSPSSVIDVGCGLGTWLSVFASHGCEILGLDGVDVAEELLDIPRDRFRVVDLEEAVQAPGRFDLAISLEVAEHLSEASGPQLVKLLTSVSDTVVFSAAVPGQGGDNHVNEQWPAYWQRLFADRGFSFEDNVRWRFWDNEEVDWWYRQNMFVAQRVDLPREPVTSVVHPRLLEKKMRMIDDFYAGRVPLRTGGLVFARCLLNALRSG